MSLQQQSELSSSSVDSPAEEKNKKRKADEMTPNLEENEALLRELNHELKEKKAKREKASGILKRIIASCDDIVKAQKEYPEDEHYMYRATKILAATDQIIVAGKDLESVKDFFPSRVAPISKTIQESSTNEDAIMAVQEVAKTKDGKEEEKKDVYEIQLEKAPFPPEELVPESASKEEKEKKAPHIARPDGVSDLKDFIKMTQYDKRTWDTKLSDAILWYPKALIFTKLVPLNLIACSEEELDAENDTVGSLLEDFGSACMKGSQCNWRSEECYSSLDPCAINMMNATTFINGLSLHMTRGMPNGEERELFIERVKNLFKEEQDKQDLYDLVEATYPLA